MVKLYGSPKSSAGRCFWALEEVGIRYEAVSISFKDNEHKSEEFLKLNPNGKIPALVDGDFVLWESIAINRYLAESHKPELLGDGLQNRALVHQWSTWSQLQYQPPMIDVFIQLNFVPEPRRSQDTINKALAKITPMHEMLEAHLTGKTYFVGEQFSLADLNLASVARLSPMLRIDLSPYPNLQAWIKRVTSRPACKRVDELD